MENEEERNPEVEALIESNLRLVLKIANDFLGRGLPWEDLVSEGNRGLVIAARRYDPARGARFSTYSACWIKQAIHQAIAEQGQTVRVPVWDMFLSILFVVALPVSLGLVINRLCRKHADLLAKICPVVSSAGIVLVIGIIVALNAGNLRSCGPQVFLAVVLHNGAGLAAGYWFARLFRCDRRTAVTIAIEVGMQNSGLAAALSKQFFGLAAALPGAVFSIWHNLSGAAFASMVRHRIQPGSDEKPE